MSLLGTLVTVAEYATWLGVVYLFLLGDYRMLLHPLALYPGPLLAKVTDAYGGLHAAKKTLHLKTWRDHIKYGPVLRQGPNKLVFNSATALNDIYLNDRVSKSHCYQAGNFTPGAWSTFNAIDKNVHRRKRKLVGQAVTERSMRMFEPTMTEQIDIFLEQLLKACQESHQTINMTEICKKLTIDVIGHLAFGYPLNLQSDPIHQYLVQALAIASYRMNVYMQFPLLRKLQMEILFYFLAVLQGKSFMKTLTKMIKFRLAEDKHAKPDLYSMMVDSLHAPDGDRITLQEIWTEAISFFPAGADTTSAAISALFFYLSIYPECYRRLVEEIRTSFATSADIKGGAQLTNCRYLRACIDETLRLSPPIGGTLWRENTQQTDEPFIVDGHIIPPGTQVGVNIYALHHNERYFPDPFTFNPERFLSSHTRFTRSAFAPFSIGSRACAGKALAYLEISLTVAKTLWHFDFEKATGPPGKPRESVIASERVFQAYDIFTSAHDGPFLTFHPRNDF
ncbi:benzoate 4-monooxygenase cytochrome P450 [Whalleya microplaca]|nr:benzoate 4-monooxygenase cytochrome P450 [Whalleya microplaca]